MGLDATAYETATLTEPHEQTEDCWEGDHVHAYIIDPDFHRSLRGLVADRCYATSGKSADVGNSYGGHGKFREKLALIFLGTSPEAVWESPDQYAAHPFFELIHFADNEGTIGPEAAADLAADFEAGRARWRSHLAENDYLLRKYDEWAEVFAVAANGGIVRFA